MNDLTLNFERAEDISPGAPADLYGAVFEEVTVQDNGTIHFVVSNGDEFDKDPDELVFTPK